MSNCPEYRCLDKFSKDIGIPAANLIKAFEIEKEFHADILQEHDNEKRKLMYREVYETVHPIYGAKPLDIPEGNRKNRIVRLLRKELENRSILEVGCGNGFFLSGVANMMKHKELVGLDISTPALPKSDDHIQFVNADIIDFNLERKFDVVYSEHVIEHLAPMDLSAHINSVKRALEEDGSFIVVAPNKLFGPSDVTRIIDYTYTNRTTAQGTHLNEPTYTELIQILRDHGFSSFKTVLPVPRLRYMVPRLRLDARILMTIERNDWLMKLLHAVRYNSQCIARFDTVLICRR